MPLTLAKETMEMNWKEPVGRQSGQILLEGDMIVPDSKPDLQEILRCEGKVKIREKRITDDRLSFSGEVEVTVLYGAKNGEKPLYAMKSTLPMEDFLHMDGLGKDMDVDSGLLYCRAERTAILRMKLWWILWVLFGKNIRIVPLLCP